MNANYSKISIKKYRKWVNFRTAYAISGKVDKGKKHFGTLIFIYTLEAINRLAALVES